MNPDLIVADEPVSSLDMSELARILNLLNELQEEYDLTFLFIAYDLNVVCHISDSASVMYLGELVEFAETEKLFTDPAHPYTNALLSAIPEPEPDNVPQRTPTWYIRAGPKRAIGSPDVTTRSNSRTVPRLAPATASESVHYS